MRKPIILKYLHIIQLLRMNLRITISLKNNFDYKVNFYKQVADYVTEIKFIEYVPDSKELTLA